MIRLAILSEGRTEEEFVKQVLAAFLRDQGVESYPIPLNGNITMERIAQKMGDLLYNFDALTSLVDYYGFRDKGQMTPQEIEARISETVSGRMSRKGRARRYRIIPYVQRYEFEALLFSDVDAFSNQGIIQASLDSVEDLREIRSKFSNPEEINDSSRTAPSKRIIRLMNQYDKVIHGPLLAKEIGLQSIRNECPRFDNWMIGLEVLGGG